MKSYFAILIVAVCCVVVFVESKALTKTEDATDVSTTNVIPDNNTKVNNLNTRLDQLIAEAKENEKGFLELLAQTQELRKQVKETKDRLKKLNEADYLNMKPEDVEKL